VRRPDARSAAEDTRGAVFVELLIVALPLLVAFLLLVQMSMAFMTSLVVQHAANAAARAAVVAAAEDPSVAPPFDELDQFLGALGSGPVPAGGSDHVLRTVRNAAAMRLMAISPPFQTGTQSRTVRRALARPEGMQLRGPAAYVRRAVGVTFPGGQPTTGNGDISVTVSYLMECSIPLGDYFVCDDPGGLSVNSALNHTDLRQGTRRYALMQATATLPLQGRVARGAGRGVADDPFRLADP
jgi:hypothetical protein